MVTKGIIYQVLSPYSAKVRMPFYDQMENSKNGTSNENLATATICALPNTSYYLEKGDIVWVDFEDNDISKPVIIGLLQKASGNQSIVDLTTNKLKTNNIELNNSIITEKSAVNNLENFSKNLSILTNTNNNDILNNNIGIVLNAIDGNLYKLNTDNGNYDIKFIPVVKEIHKTNNQIDYIKIQISATNDIQLNSDGTYTIEEI